MTNTNVGVSDFVKYVMEGKEMDEGKEYDFMIACGGSPSKDKFDSVARVICVQTQDVKDKKRVTYVMPDELAEFELEWIKLKHNRTIKLGLRKTYFTELENTTEKTFRDNSFFEYGYGVIRAQLLKR